MVWGLKNPAELISGFAALTLDDGGGAFVLIPNMKNEDRGIVASQLYAAGREWLLSVILGGGLQRRGDLDLASGFLSAPPAGEAEGAVPIKRQFFLLMVLPIF